MFFLFKHCSSIDWLSGRAPPEQTEISLCVGVCEREREREREGGGEGEEERGAERRTVCCCSPLSSGPPLGQSILWKRSGSSLNKEWKKKYVTLLNNGTLRYPSSFNVSHPTPAPQQGHKGPFHSLLERPRPYQGFPCCFSRLEIEEVHLLYITKNNLNRDCSVNE